MTGGALLGIKLIGRNAEHVVALNAHAMDNRTDNRAGLDGFGCSCGNRARSLTGSELSGHGDILARGCLQAKEALGIPKVRRGIRNMWSQMAFSRGIAV